MAGAFSAPLGARLCATAAAAAGLQGRDKLIMAVAIAGAESGWRFDAKGDANLPHEGCASYGYWQINSCPDRDAGSPTRHGENPQLLFDPLVNARAMVAISSGGENWSPWTVFKTGKYRDKIIQAADAVEKLDPKLVDEWSKYEKLSDRPDKGGTFGFAIGTPFGDITSESGPTGVLTDAVNAAVDPLQAVAKFFGLLLQGSTWLRVLSLVLGLVVLVLGIRFIINDQGVALP